SGAPRTVQDAATPDLRPEGAPPPLTLAEIQARMPEKAQIVQYAALEDKLVMWVVSGARPIVPRAQQISANDLTGLLHPFRHPPRTQPRREPQGDPPRRTSRCGNCAAPLQLTHRTHRALS